MDKLIKRLLRVALVGSPNVGKSTLLNKLVRGEISCVSNKVHTTRQNILGVYTQGAVQLEFYDSPGMVTREHLLKHRLEDPLMTDPTKAAHLSDLLVVVVDAGNIREQKRLNRGLVKMLHDHQDKKSVLVLNKVDLVKNKRSLLDISTRLSQGCLENRLTFDRRDLKRMSPKLAQELNLQSHLPGIMGTTSMDGLSSTANKRPQHQYVIELDEPKKADPVVDNLDRQTPERSPSPWDENFDPNLMSYKNFSHIFSISALHDEGVDHLRDYLIKQAQPVVEWPHGPSYLSNQTSKEIVHSVIRGRVMDESKHSAPYTIGFKYRRCEFDEIGTLHVTLCLQCPKAYMMPMLIGDQGATMIRIIDGARASISRTLGCEAKIDIQVEHVPSVSRLLTYEKSRIPGFQKRDLQSSNQPSSDLNDNLQRFVEST